MILTMKRGDARFIRDTSYIFTTLLEKVDSFDNHYENDISFNIFM